MARQVLDVALAFDAQHKRCVDGRIEKHVLRRSGGAVRPRVRGLHHEAS